MIKKTLRVKDETAKWVEKGAKDRKIGEGQFLDIVALSWNPDGEVQAPIPEGHVIIAEELELTNGLLKIARDDEGLPEAFVRAKITDGWTKIDWRKLEAMNIEVQGLKRDRLAHEVELQKGRELELKKKIEKLAIANARNRNKLTVGVRNEMEMEKDTAETGDGFPKWCLRDKITIDTPEELETHRAAGCTFRDLEPGELYSAREVSRAQRSADARTWKGQGFAEK